MASPPRLTELKCPDCLSVHWTIDEDYRGTDGSFEPYNSRLYDCPHCLMELSGFELLRQSPPEFLLQPHDLYPMTRKDFNYWLGILKREFPNHFRLSRSAKKFRPRTPKQAHRRLPAVLEMTDEEESKSIYPKLDTAMEWLGLMEEDGAFLIFFNKNGGKLVITLTGSHTFDAVFKNSRGRTRRILTGLTRPTVTAIIERYLRATGWRSWLRTLREMIWIAID